MTGSSGQIRAGVIGAGAWAVASHIPSLAQRPEVELVAVCRHGEHELAEISNRWGFAVASQEYADVLARDLDLVVISSPSALHHEHAAAALDSGAHVLVEKPFTLVPDDAWDLVDRADRADRHLVVAFGYNYRPVTQTARALLAEHGGIGQIEGLNISMSSGTRTLLLNQGAYPQAAGGYAPDPDTWTDPELSGGGYAQAQLCHALGIGMWLTGLRARRVYATMRRPEGSRVELSDALVVDYSGGAIGSVAGTSAHPGFLAERDQLHVRVIGTAGHLDLDFDRDEVALFRPDGTDDRRQLQPGAGAYDCWGPPNALVDLILGDGDNCSPGELGARTVELLAAAYASASSGQPQTVDHDRARAERIA